MVGEVELSVLVPARNEARTIGSQLDALLAQEWGSTWEIVVVDNGSEDGTGEIARAHADPDGRISVVDASARRGLSFARNTGISVSRGEAFALCDADDIVTTGWVAAMGDALKVHPLVTGPLELDQLNPPWLADSRGRGDERETPTFYGTFPFPHGGNLGVRRHTWEELGGFDETVPNGAEDVEFGLRAALAGVTVAFVPGASVQCRYRTDPRALWRQGLTYGTCRPLIKRRMKDHHVNGPPWYAGWRSWAWLLRHVIDLGSAEGRPAWIWVAGSRVGHVVGSVRHRCVLL